MFVGRDAELSELKRMHESEKFEFAVVYGRRRVGKTTLIREFGRGRRFFYFVARESDSAANLRVLSEELASQGFLQTGTYFKSWDAALMTLQELAADKRLIAAIDEYPYLAAAEPSISSLIQTYIDGTLKEGKLFLILCGSSMSFMENQILGHKSPLYGRRTAQFKIKPFDFFTARAFMAGFQHEEQAALYGAVGGTPEYLAQIKNDRSFKENITALFLKDFGPLYEEPASLLKQELREPFVYNSIIAAIAGGASRLNEISTKAQMESNKVSKYLTSLISLGIVKKENPAGEKPGRKSIYRLADEMFRFWYRFVFPNMSAVASGSGDIVYDKKVLPELSNFMGSVFEEICAQFLWGMQRRGSLPIFVSELGRWWGADPEHKTQQEIDILAKEGDAALFVECKWRSVPADMSVLAALIDRSELFAVRERYYYIFSKCGFTRALRQKASEMKNLTLYSFDEMVDEAESCSRP